jgi:hypothetical protein
MSNVERIEEGDLVAVDFNNVSLTLSLKAEVLHIPVATGDSWIFSDIATDKIHYVSEGCTITLIIKGNNGE